MMAQKKDYSIYGLNLILLPCFKPIFYNLSLILLCFFVEKMDKTDFRHKFGKNRFMLAI